MLKRWKIFINVSCGHTQVSSARIATNPKTGPGANKAQDAKSQQPAPVDPSASPQPIYSPRFNNNAAQKTEKDGWDKASVFANCILVFVGIGGIIAAVLTLRAINRQADLMETQAEEAREAATTATAIAQKAAEAALLNAQALIHSKRPWVIVQIEEIAGENAAKTRFRLSAYNHGDSPARVISCKGPTITWLENPDSELPAVPDYGTWEWDSYLLLPRHKLALRDEIDPFSAQVTQGIPDHQNGSLWSTD